MSIVDLKGFIDLNDQGQPIIHYTRCNILFYINTLSFLCFIIFYILHIVDKNLKKPPSKLKLLKI